MIAQVERTESQMIRRAKSGDAQAVNQFAETYRPVLMSIANRKLRNAEDAADVVQETLVKAIKSLKDFDESRPVRPWLARICHNCIVDLVRHRRHSETDLESCEYAVSDGGLSVENAERALMSGQILTAVKNLPWRYRQLIQLRHFEHLDVNEIADRLRKPEGTIKSWLFRARVQLKRELALQFA